MMILYLNVLLEKMEFQQRKLKEIKKPQKAYIPLDLYILEMTEYQNQITLLKSIPIKENMGWCDDVKSKFYNKIINTKKKLRHEKLFIKKNDYDLLIPINYNTKKTKKGKGSAIFLHLTKNYKKTLGCIAINKKDMIILLKIITQKTKIEIT
jgi:L,D-peptidoglycan transpeptidase YkuD (ErfK/YbiS/YcfS/YnhG family)